MTTPLVFKAFDLIQKINHYSYIYIVTWESSTRTLHITKSFRKLIPWHIANIGVVFLLHFCLSVFVIIYRKTTGEKVTSNKDALQFGVLMMMSFHSTASYGINFLFYRHCREWVPFYNILIRFESRVRNHYISSKEIKKASVLNGNYLYFSVKHFRVLQ